LPDTDEALRILIDGQKNYVPPASSHLWQHGTAHGYTSHGCRCRLCKDAHAARALQSKGGPQPRESRLGTDLDRIRAWKALVLISMGKEPKLEPPESVPAKSPTRKEKKPERTVSVGEAAIALDKPRPAIIAMLVSGELVGTEDSEGWKVNHRSLMEHVRKRMEMK
jgi:hypothetical protein